MPIIATFAKLDILALLLIEFLLWILSEIPMISLKYLHYQYINLTMRSRAVSWQLNGKVDIFQETGCRGLDPDDRQDGSVAIGLPGHFEMNLQNTALSERRKKDG
jgi:hypothetical protein